MTTQPNLDWTATDERAVDLIRVLAMDAVQKVGNGHPGTAMSLAPAAYLLFQRVMRHDPADPHWPGRDRFVLAALGSQGVIGYIQYFTHLPAGLVWVHVTGSVLVWIAVLRLYFTVREQAPVNTARTGPVVTAPSRQPEPLDR